MSRMAIDREDFSVEFVLDSTRLERFTEALIDGATSSTVDLLERVHAHLWQEIHRARNNFDKENLLKVR